MFGYDSYGRPIGEDGFGHLNEGDGVPIVDDGNGHRNFAEHHKTEGENNFFGKIIGKLIIFCLFIYGFPVAPTEIKWIMVIFLCFWFRRLIFRLIKGFWKWLS